MDGVETYDSKKAPFGLEYGNAMALMLEFMERTISRMGLASANMSDKMVTEIHQKKANDINNLGFLSKGRIKFKLEDRKSLKK